MAKDMSDFFVLTVTLNPALDKVFDVEDFSLRSEHRVKRIFLSPGGKGINVSRALKNLGVRALATGFVGGIAGQELQKGLSREGIPFDFVSVAGNTRTNYTILDQNGCTTRLLEPGPVISKKEAHLLYRKLVSLLPRCRCVVFCGQQAPGLDEDFIARLIQTAQKSNKKVFVDTSGPPLRAAFRVKPYFIKPNLAEAESILKRRLTSFREFKKALKYFRGHGVRRAVISMGERGAVASDGKEFWRATAPVPAGKKISHAVGCGDALLAGFIFAEIRKKYFSESLRFAVACGAANLSAVCPGDIQKVQVRKLLRKVHLKKF